MDNSIIISKIKSLITYLEKFKDKYQNPELKYEE